MLRAISAKTKYPNTPETDNEKYAVHVVTLSNGKVIEVSATDPMDAISRANKMYGEN